MDVLRDIFSLVCGQGRCFEVGGEALPVCQRCLGLYVGAAIAAAWLAAGGVWRRGLPSRGVFAVHVVVLLTALFGGLHLLDYGPAWRLTCGLWTGQVIVLWWVGAGARLRVLRGGPSPQRPWRRADKIGAMALAGAMPLLAGAFGRLARLGWTFWTAVTVLGALALVASALWAGANLLAWLLRRKKPPTDVGG